MIDQAYQAEINKNLDAQQFGPKGPAAGPGTWQNFGAGAGGFVAGPLQFGAAWSDMLQGASETMAATGTMTGQGMFAVPTPKEQADADAAAARLALNGPNMDSPVGADLRVKAKEFMPDPQSTGKAGQVLGGVANFASQAIPAAMAGPTGLVALGTARGVQKSEDLKEQGVDPFTRTVAGTVSGTLDAASMVLPMTGPTRLIAAGKGAAGGVATSVAQTEAEKLILEHGGYDKLASTYDPFDPTSIALSALVPAAFGGLHSPTAAKAPGGARAEPTHADVTLSPEEAAHSQRVEDSSIDSDLTAIDKELASQKNPEAIQALTEERARLARRKEVLNDPATQDAARVMQTASAIDHSRLTPDDDIAGHDQHARAVETASDQIARGEPVEVTGAPLNSRIEPINPQPVDVVRTKAGELDIAATEKALPLVADGDVRLYRAESPTTSFPDVFNPEDLAAHRHPEIDGQRYTTDLTVADYYRDAYNGKGDASIHYIDVPRDVAERGRIADDEFKVSVPRENASRAQTARVVETARAVQKLAEARDAARESPAVKAPPERAEGEAAARRPPAAEKAAAPEGAAEHPGPAQLEATTAEILSANPDLMVQLDGMEPMRAADLLEAVRQSAAEDMRDASLLETAAQCAISL